MYSLVLIPVVQVEHVAVQNCVSGGQGRLSGQMKNIPTDLRIKQPSWKVRQL